MHSSSCIHPSTQSQCIRFRYARRLVRSQLFTQLEYIPHRRSHHPAIQPTTHPLGQDVFLTECTHCLAIRLTAHPVRIHSVLVHSSSHDPTETHSVRMYSFQVHSSSYDPTIHPPSQDVFLTTALVISSQSITRRRVITYLSRLLTPRDTDSSQVHPSLDQVVIQPIIHRATLAH